MARLFLFLSLVAACYSSVCASAEGQKSITMRDATGSNAGDYVKALLDIAYAELGLKTRYVDIPGKTELAMASKGRIDAALARQAGIEKEYPQLIRVDVPILTFKLMQIADKSVCGLCEEKDITSVGYSQGAIIATEHANNLPRDVKKLPLAYDNPSNLLQFLARNRVDAVYLMDFQISEDLDLTRYSVRAIDQELDYHYLSPQLAHLKEPLQEVLTSLLVSDEISKLKQQYGVE